ncbi:hypothetical protein [Lysobacter sp. GCM10012299]|uniref:hypothetical protein n=1 Tax=Lysobacter sp. GCM10012299 TaxID=3317333 RepID=UPI003614009C
MNTSRLLAAVFIAALAIPAAQAQQSDGRATPVAEASFSAADNHLAVRLNSDWQPPTPWAIPGTAPDLAIQQVDLKFADETPLKPGMFDSPTAWEDEP